MRDTLGPPRLENPGLRQRTLCLSSKKKTSFYKLGLPYTAAGFFKLVGWRYTQTKYVRGRDTYIYGMATTSNEAAAYPSHTLGSGLGCTSCAELTGRVSGLTPTVVDRPASKAAS